MNAKKQHEAKKKKNAFAKAEQLMADALGPTKEVALRTYRRNSGSSGERANATVMP
jgi:hypothetical protein